MAIPILVSNLDTSTGIKVYLFKKLTAILKFLPVTKVNPWLEISMTISEEIL